MKNNLLNSVSRYGRVVKELVFPRRCALCGGGIEVGYLCDSCRKPYLLQKEVQCAEGDVLKSIMLLYKYSGIYKDNLLKVKTNGDTSLLPFLREEAEAAMPSGKMEWLHRFDLITTVPASADRIKAHGFDLSHELFAPVVDVGATVYSDYILRRVRNTAPLKGMSPAERKEEVVGSFTLGSVFKLAGKHILICDDIYSTGVTFREAAQVLLNAGAADVSVLAFAMAGSLGQE